MHLWSINLWLTTDWFQIGKRVHQGCILSSCLFNLYAEYIMWNAGLDESQAGIKIARRNQQPQVGREWRELKNLLDECERGEWKSWLEIQHSKNKDHGIQSHHFMANRWGNCGNCGNSSCPYFSGLQNHCRWWLQPWNKKTLAPWKKSYDQPRQHIEKQRHYFVNKSPSSQGYGFSSGHVWMWELDCEESWALKNWCF